MSMSRHVKITRSEISNFKEVLIIDFFPDINVKTGKNYNDWPYQKDQRDVTSKKS